MSAASSQEHTRKGEDVREGTDSEYKRTIKPRSSFWARTGDVAAVRSRFDAILSDRWGEKKKVKLLTQ
ncbi:hypothetical protein JOB18_001781 [Solea senegalensis]|uniref:Uncharacterized protein n=1 Tax=Solea senegalensis TaxID=28829 RepID=A0AAV6SEV3_SOLSE|nr:hypothetical protein JOB18_001781 [Solea senegalensis]